MEEEGEGLPEVKGQISLWLELPLIMALCTTPRSLEEMVDLQGD